MTEDKRRELSKMKADEVRAEKVAKCEKRKASSGRSTFCGSRRAMRSQSPSGMSVRA